MGQDSCQVSRQGRKGKGRMGYCRRYIAVSKERLGSTSGTVGTQALTVGFTAFGRLILRRVAPKKRARTRTESRIVSIDDYLQEDLISRLRTGRRGSKHRKLREKGTPYQRSLSPCPKVRATKRKTRVSCGSCSDS